MLINQFKERLQLSNDLYLDFINHVPESYFGSKLSNLPSNEIGQQLWCVVGARESYLKAIIAGKWEGFSCSLPWDKTKNSLLVKDAFIKTHSNIHSYFESGVDVSEESLKFLFNLLEHEVQHHGQLVRYLYGLKLGVPDSWKKRYSLD